MCAANSVVQRFQRQTDTQVTAIARDDAKLSRHIVNRLATAAKVLWIDRRSEVLHVDPIRDDHGCCHNLLKHRKLVVIMEVIAVKERATAKRDAFGHIPRSDYKCSVAS